eukprot:PhM_4_TR5189/c4_g1_i1/m.99205
MYASSRAARNAGARDFMEDFDDDAAASSGSFHALNRSSVNTLKRGLSPTSGGTSSVLLTTESLASPPAAGQQEPATVSVNGGSVVVVSPTPSSSGRVRSSSLNNQAPLASALLNGHTRHPTMGPRRTSFGPTTFLHPVTGDDNRPMEEGASITSFIRSIGGAAAAGTSSSSEDVGRRTSQQQQQQPRRRSSPYPRQRNNGTDEINNKEGINNNNNNNNAATFIVVSNRRGGANVELGGGSGDGVGESTSSSLATRGEPPKP